MPSPELGQVDVVEVIHLDGTRGVARFRIIGIVPIPELEPKPQPEPAAPTDAQGAGDA